MRKLVAAFLAAVLALSVMACARQTAPVTSPAPENEAAAQPSTPEDGGTLNLSMYAAPKGVFNPIVFEDMYDANVIGLVFNGLVKVNEKLEWVPDLARSYTSSPDNKQVTFELRDDVKWHDGEPFTAEDVAFTFKSMLDPRYPGVRSGDFMAILGAAEFRAGQADDVAGIKVEGDHKITFILKEPYAPILQRLAFPIIPAHIFKDVDLAQIAEHERTRHPIGTGPFKFVQYKPGQYVELERNPDYFGGAPHIARVIYKIVNQEVALGQLQSGELDFTEAQPADIPVLEQMPNVQIFEQPSFTYQYLGFNHRNPLLADKAVRQAIMYGINRQAMVDQLLDGHGKVMNSHMPPVSWAYDGRSHNPYPYDPAKAEQLLQAAGYTRGPDGIYQKGGQRLEFNLKYPKGYTPRELSAPLIQDNLKQIGIKVNLELLEFTTMVEQVFDKHQADLWLGAWSTTVDPDPSSIFLIDPQNKWSMVTGWQAPARQNELILEGLRKLKIEDRKPIYAEWDKLLNEELPYAFLYTQNDVYVVSKRLRGLKPDIRGVFWNLPEIWIPKDLQ